MAKDTGNRAIIARTQSETTPLDFAHTSAKRLVCLLLAFGLVFAQMHSALAKKHPPGRRHQTLISQVSPTSLTIDEDGAPRTFAITRFTEVMVNDQKGTVGELKTGMRVSVVLEDAVKVRQIKAWNTN